MSSPDENPFLGLKPYELKDRKKFYGRDKDLFLMKDRVFSGRTTLLFAASGVGKTSFINAKIIPELNEQYYIVYHNQWTVGEPLQNLKESLSASAPPERADGSLEPPGPQNSLINQLSGFIKSKAEFTTPKNRCLIILDQFEEVFQHHANEKYFAKFIEELSELINFNECNARVMFSMREEFLGELSIFDNKIPDLFGNYYRLKCPNKQEAQEIIERTCSLVERPVDASKLEILVGELTQADKGRLIDGDAHLHEDSFERDIVAPPYLQIACQRLWNKQFPSTDGERTDDQNGNSKERFLTNYQSGDAWRMLRLFCREKLANLSNRERALLADAFDFLVTKRGAKMAYELSSLAEHMGVEEKVLKDVLLKLSRPESRILRQTNGPDHSLWFELYHDMYGPIIDEWKRSYQRERRTSFQRALRVASVLLATFTFIAVLIWGFNKYLWEPKQYETTLKNANLQDTKSFGGAQNAYTELTKIWGYGTTAKRLWSAAWQRRAKFAEEQENSQEAFLSWLRAGAEGTSEQQEEISRQISPYLTTNGYQGLIATERLDPESSTPGNTPMLSADGKALLSLGSDLRVLRWDIRSQELSKSEPLMLDGSNPASTATGSKLQNSSSSSSSDQATGSKLRNSSSSSSSDQSASYALQISSAAQNLVGGINRQGFRIWSVDTGAKVWEGSEHQGPRHPPNSAYGQNYSALPSIVSSPGQNYSNSNSIVFSPDARHFATTDDRGTVQIYKLENEKFKPFGHQVAFVSKIAFNPKKPMVLLFLTNNTIRVLDLESGVWQSPNAKLMPLAGPSFSPDGSKFLAATPGVFNTFEYDQYSSFLTQQREIQIWDTDSMKQTGRSLAESVTRWAEYGFCNDNKTVAVADFLLLAENRKALTITFWDSADGQLIGSRITSLDNIETFRLNPDGSSVLTLGSGGMAHLWGLTYSENDKKLIKDASKFLQWVSSADGQVVATLNDKQMVTFWDPEKSSQIGSPLSLDKPDVFGPPTQSGNKRGPSNLSNRFALSPHGKWAVITNGSQFVVWDVKNNRRILNGSPRDAVLYRFSPNDDNLAISESGVLSLWRQLSTKPTESKITFESKFIYPLLFSADNNYLAALDSDEKIGRSMKLVDLTTGTVIKSFDEGLKFAPSVFAGNAKIFGILMNKLEVLDVIKGSSIVITPAANISAFTTNADGSRVFTSTIDGVLQMWDSATGNSLFTKKLTTRFRSLRISGDGKTLVALSDNWIHLFSIKDKVWEYKDGQPFVAFSVPQIVDATGQNLRSVSLSLPNTLEIQSISFSSPLNSQFPQKQPAELLEEWKKKLFLDFDPLGQLNPPKSSQ